LASLTKAVGVSRHNGWREAFVSLQPLYDLFDRVLITRLSRSTLSSAARPRTSERR
jgi:hypothetical protein